MLGGNRTFWERIPICRPALPDFSEISEKYAEVFDTGQITNGNHVREFEERTEEYLGVKNAVAVSSCTSGLMLAQKALELKGEVIVPSFTFSATVHSILWNGLKPVFVDCNPETFNLDVKLIREKITDKTCAIMAVYIFGNPPEITKLEEIATEYDLRLIFDAAHAFGSRYHERFAGNFGDVEIFSLSPTKVLVAGEGGIAATNNNELARKIRIGRDYGNPGDYNCEFTGLNARMTEFNAVLGIRNLKNLEDNIAKRNNLADIYRFFLSKIPGISFQKIEKGMRSTYKDFSILIDAEIFGLNRDVIALCLDRENVETKKYYFPPVHIQDACRRACENDTCVLPATDYISQNILSLPIYSDMTEEEAVKICEVIRKIYEEQEKIIKYLKCNFYEEVKV